MREQVNPLAVIGIFFSILISFPSIAKAEFPDVLSVHVNYDAISYVQEKGYVGGYSDGSYKPDNKLTRAEFTKILINSRFDASEIEGCVEANFKDKSIFPDLNGELEEKFGKYICIAKIKGIVNGYTDGTYQAENNINFGEASKIITNSFEMINEGDTDPNHKFGIYVKALSDVSAIPETITIIENHINRAEMAEVIYRLDSGKTNLESNSYDDLINLGDIVPKPHPTDNQNITLFETNLYSMYYPSIFKVDASYDTSVGVKFKSDSGSEFIQTYSQGIKYTDYYESQTRCDSTAEKLLESEPKAGEIGKIIENRFFETNHTNGCVVTIEISGGLLGDIKIYESYRVENRKAEYDQAVNLHAVVLKYNSNSDINTVENLSESISLFKVYI